MKTKNTTHLHPKVEDAMHEFIEGVNPHATMAALLEVMRMMGKDEMMKESDPAAEEIWNSLYYLIRLLRAMQQADLQQIKKGSK